MTSSALVRRSIERLSGIAARGVTGCASITKICQVAGRNALSFELVFRARLTSAHYNLPNLASHLGNKVLILKMMLFSIDDRSKCVSISCRSGGFASERDRQASSYVRRQIPLI